MTKLRFVSNSNRSLEANFVVEQRMCSPSRPPYRTPFTSFGRMHEAAACMCSVHSTASLTSVACATLLYLN